jgi:hypothetical protein
VPDGLMVDLSFSWDGAGPPCALGIAQQLQQYSCKMEEGSKAKKTVFVGGIGEEVNEEIILEAFSVFGVFGLEWRSHFGVDLFAIIFLGDVIDVQLPTNATGRPHENRCVYLFS